MLNIGGRVRGRDCDGVTRRDFLKIGGLALGGLALPGILRAEAARSIKSSNKSVIMVFLAGGPPHQDMFDLKMNAPAEIRGEFRPIETNIPGVEICEHMPRLARMMDKVAVIRTMVGAHGNHSAGQCLTGYTDAISQVQGGRPSLGAILSKLEGPRHASVPPFVGLSPKMGHNPWSNPGDPGYLGMAHSPFTPFRTETAAAAAGPEVALEIGRLGSRRSLLGELDSLRRQFDQDKNGAIAGLDEFTGRAFDILTSGKLFQALDVTKEDPRIRAKYGIGDMNNEFDGPPCCNDHFLMARRLVEAGARCVTIGFGRWDTHSDNFSTCAKRIPKLDAALSTLIEDLHLRGMDKDVSVVVWGEFGRTPKINPQAGRDHWPQVSFALLAGGGMRTGQVIGSTDRNAEGPKDRPVTFQNVFATLYHCLGIGPEAHVPDRNGRPMYLLDRFEPVHELI